MEASARGAKEAGGRTIGVTTEEFGGPVNRWIDREIRMKKWSERLFKLIGLGDAFVFLNGGTGTLVELFVVWEMSNKKLISKPVIVLGQQLHDLLTQIKEYPHVVSNPNLFLVDTPDQVFKLLGEKIERN